jgi:DNA-binding CsgD family transcriptional regulator
MILVVLRGSRSNFLALLRRLGKDLPDLLEASPPPVEQSPVIKQHQRRLPPEEVAGLVAEYRAGDTMTLLAERYGVHPMTVTAHLKRAGLDLTPKRMSESEIDDAVQLYTAGWSLERIADRLGVTAMTVQRRLVARGLPRRKPWERD